ncbi:MAG: hypothetical protein JWO22_3909, partial [Frankiales bacterium]|nr:hypothetical protein [Frankiales bacterium]
MTLRTGFEVELLAPKGTSRRDLADELARRCGGSVEPVWHRDSEPSLVEGLGRFLHLTQGFDVRRSDGSLLCGLVDDITIVDELDRTAPPLPGWHRVLTDDPRLLELLAVNCPSDAAFDEVLDDVADMWDVPVYRYDGILQVNDGTGATIALASLQGSERERPCELVTPPLVDDHERLLEELLGPARELGFSVPVEAAVHLHLDGAPFRDPAVLSAVVRLFSERRDELWELLGTNPRCRRLAPLPDDLVRAASAPGATWQDLAEAATGVTKFHDINVSQLFARRPIRDTVEVRILPGSLNGQEICKRAAVVEDLLADCFA